MAEKNPIGVGESANLDYMSVCHLACLLAQADTPRSSTIDVNNKNHAHVINKPGEKP